MKKLLIIIFFVSLFHQNLISQTYNEYLQEFFFDRLPSAKVEAMGKILSVGTESHFVSQSNPASLVQSKGLSAFYSHSTPYYLGKDFQFYYSGLSYNFINIGAFAINMIWLDMGETFYTDIDGNSEKVNASRKILTLSYAREISGLFKLGINSNLFIDDFNPDESYNGSFFDLGILKDIHQIKNNTFENNTSIGLFIKNIFNQGIEYSNYISVGHNDQKEYFPSILRVGISNELKYFNPGFYNKSHLIGLTTAIEYQNVVNYKYKTAIKFGAELSFLDLINARCGYFNESQLKASNSKGELTSFTYGFGINLEWSKLLNTNSPFSMTFDYASLPQPTYVVDFDDWDNFTIYSIRLNYLFE